MRIEAEALEELVSSLRRRVGVVGIAVGGSLARGEARTSSDLDVLVLTDAGEPSRVEAFQYAGRPTEALFMRADTLRAALDDARRETQTVATWAGARILHDTDGLLASMLAELEARYRCGPAPLRAEERDYALFELAHVRGLIAEAAVGAAPTDEATCRLLIAVATRLVVGALLHQAQRWPVGWRQTLPALRALDADAAALAERTLTAPGAAAVDAAFSLLDRAERALGGPLRPGLDQLC